MKHKLVISWSLASALAIITVVGVLSGATFDLGLIEGTPPANQANWTAWINEAKNILPGGMPNEIMTEDNTVSDIGINYGYANWDLDTDVEWCLQVENFSNEVHGDKINMIFGGLGLSTGKLWFYNFNWDQLSESITDHGTVPLSATTRACPTLNSVSVNGNDKTISFTAEPNKTYYIYKSTQPSGAGNDASNGRYLYLATVVTNASGVGSYVDTEPLQSWYTIIPKSETSGALGGCHSEESSPTAVDLVDFTAQVQFPHDAVLLAWSTANELGVFGFNIYRADEPGGLRLKLNAELIPAQYPGQVLGGAYSFEDANILPGRSYSYWIEVVKIAGLPEETEPQIVIIPLRFYLPLMIR